MNCIVQRVSGSAGTVRGLSRSRQVSGITSSSLFSMSLSPSTERGDKKKKRKAKAQQPISSRAVPSGGQSLYYSCRSRKFLKTIRLLLKHFQKSMLMRPGVQNIASVGFFFFFFYNLPEISDASSTHVFGTSTSFLFDFSPAATRSAFASEETSDAAVRGPATGGRGWGGFTRVYCTSVDADR